MNYNKKYAFSLSTHQFRVRHIQGVQVKQLQGSPTRTHACILHPTQRTVVHQTASYHESLNPQWVVQNSLEEIQASRDVVVQIWDSAGKKLLIEHFITLTALTYLAEKNTSDIQYQQNTIVYVINDALFYSRHGSYPDIGPNVVLEEHELKKPFCTVKHGDHTVSYDTKTVQDLHAMYKSVVEARTSCSHLKNQISNFTRPNTDDIKLDLQCRIKSLRDRHAMFAECLSRESAKLNKQKTGYVSKCKHRNTLRSDLRSMGEQMTEEMDKIEWKIRYVVKSKSKLLKRRQTLLSQLNTIFPITSDETSRKMKICGVRIHDQITDKSGEEELGPALGYTAHLVCLISSIFDVPLRFPVKPALSMSTIRDDITAKLDEKRELPLFIKGKDRGYFNYGVFLLNRNIVQLRYHCGLKTEELKEPLGNLSSLMKTRLRENISCHPPARLVPNDKIICKHKSKDSFKKTHKRVRSAPIRYTVFQDSSDLKKPYSNAPSEVSSWSSALSLRFSSTEQLTTRDSADSSAEDITVTATDKQEESSDLIDFTEEAGEENEEPSALPRSSSVVSEAASSSRSLSNRSSRTVYGSPAELSSVPEPSSLTEPSSSQAELSSSPKSPRATARELDRDSTISRGTLPLSSSPTISRDTISRDTISRDTYTMTRDTISRDTYTMTRDTISRDTYTMPRSPQNGTLEREDRRHTASSSSPVSSKRSSFKSYVRAPDLWGMSESHVRSASFKSYRTLPPGSSSSSGDTSSSSGYRGDSSPSNGDTYSPSNGDTYSPSNGDTYSPSNGDTSTSGRGDSTTPTFSSPSANSPYSTGSMNSGSSSVRTPDTPSSETRQVSMPGASLQYYSTKRYLPLESPVLVQNCEGLSTNHKAVSLSRDSARANHRTERPDSLAVVPDVCPVEVFE